MVDDENLMEKARYILENCRSFTILFSGGKDSLATLLWVLDNVRHGRWRILYTEVTGNTSPLCTEYVKKVCSKLGVEDRLVIDRNEKHDFYDVMKRAGIPIMGYYRWCLQKFKDEVWKRYAGVHVLGIKRSDGMRRRNVKPIVEYKMTHSVGILPIYDWTRGQVADYIKSHGMKINPCYEIYGHSGNCMFCPYHSKKAVILTLQDPYWGPKILEALKNIRSRTRYVESIKRKWLKHSGQLSLLV